MWATGLTYVYLEGALHRGLNRLLAPRVWEIAPPVFDEPATSVKPSRGPVDRVLNPLSVYRKSEALFRRQLAAMSSWHFVNIIQDYGLSSMARLTS